jgi:hypothetical protein
MDACFFSFCCVIFFYINGCMLVFHLINLNQGFVTANIFRRLVICIWIHFGVEYVTSKRKKLHNCLLLIITNPLPVLAKSQFVRHTAYQFQMSKFLSYLLLFLFYFSVKIGEYARWQQKWLSMPVVTLTICWTLQIVWHQSSIQKAVVCNMF